MEMKNEIYITGGEVKVVTLLDKLTPDFWLTGNLVPMSPKHVPVGIEATISRLVSDVREVLNSRPQTSHDNVITETTALNYLTRGQQRQGVMFTNAAVGWWGGLRRIGTGIGRFMYLMLVTPVL